MSAYIPTARLDAVMTEYIGSKWLESEKLAAAADVISKDRLRRVLKQEYVGFETVDLLLCRLNLPELWWGPLQDLYEEVDLYHSIRKDLKLLAEGMHRCQRRGCSNIFEARGSGPTKKIFCSKACRRAAAAERNDLLKTAPVGPRRKLRTFRCRQGHERTPENTRRRPNGTITCRICERESAKQWQFQPENRERRNAARRVSRQKAWP